MAEGENSRLRSWRIVDLPKYEIQEELGRGGMATVYRAHDARLGRDIALKVIHPHLRDSPEVVQRFAVEARIVAKLRHPNIVEVYDVSDPKDQEQYLVVECVRGVTLRQLLRERGALPAEVAAAIGLEVINALAHAHSLGVIHRDVKPENVLIANGDPPSSKSSSAEIKLTDFGIAKLLDAQGVTSTGQVLGSPAHMSPEQIEGADVTPRSDIFGLGVLLYESMVGHLPFEGNNPAQVLRRVLDGDYAPADVENASVGRSWSAILGRALEREAEARYVDCQEMRQAIGRELDRLDVVDPRAEIQAFLASPVEYAESHKKRMIKALRKSAERARREDDSLRIAADYNRAIAYAPDDHELLRALATMNAQRRRGQAMRRVGQLAAATAVAALAAFSVTRAVRVSVRPDVNGFSKASTVPVVTPAPSLSVSASVPTTVSSVVENTPLRVTLVAATAATLSARPNATLPDASTAPALASISRVLTISAVYPPGGVLLSIDGQAATPAEAPRTISIDGRSHDLLFTCKENLCKPEARRVPEGESPFTLSMVTLKVKPATLTVEGASGTEYRINEFPSLVIQSGTTTEVAINQKSKEVSVIQVGTGIARQVTLRAGKNDLVVFPN